MLKETAAAEFPAEKSLTGIDTRPKEMFAVASALAEDSVAMRD
jgi:hypothetical protein